MESLSDVIDPIGTLDELVEIGADPTRVRSCSKRTGTAAGANKGCQFFRQCRFKPWRDQQDGLKGPLNVGVEVILARVDGGKHGQKQVECFNYYAQNYRARARAAEDTGEVIRIIAYEGDGKKISEWCTRSLPPDTVNKNGKIEPYLDVHEVHRFKRPAERFPVEVGRQEAREEMMDQLEREALQNVLARTSARAEGIVDKAAAHFVLPKDEPVDVEFEGPVGKPRKVKPSA